MSGIWLASYVGLWMLVVVQTLIFLAVLRQIGVLHTRIEPRPAPPGRNADAKRTAIGGTDWFVSPSDAVALYEGRVRNVNVQVLSVLPESETERVLRSLR